MIVLSIQNTLHSLLYRRTDSSYLRAGGTDWWRHENYRYDIGHCELYVPHFYSHAVFTLWVYIPTHLPLSLWHAVCSCNTI